MPETLDTKTENEADDDYCLFSGEDACDCEEDIEELRQQDMQVKTINPRGQFYALQKESFFAYDSDLDMEDWDRYVESNPELIRARKSFERFL